MVVRIDARNASRLLLLAAFLFTRLASPAPQVPAGAVHHQRGDGIFVKGRVVDASPGPLQSVAVSLVPRGKPKQIVKQVSTGKDGVFVIGAVPAAGQFDVCFLSPGMRPRLIPLEGLKPGTDLDLGTVTLELQSIDDHPMAPYKAPKPERPIAASLCDLARHPIQFHGKMIRVRGEVLIAFEDFQLPVSSCDPHEDRNRIWLQYGKGPKSQPTTWCCGELTPQDPLELKQDRAFRAFHRDLTEQRRKNGSEDCSGRDCYVFDVTATLVGRFEHSPPRPCRHSTGLCCNNGFGHFGTFCSRLVIHSVSEVSVRDRGVSNER